jgi:hypothetical protein
MSRQALSIQFFGLLEALLSMHHASQVVHSGKRLGTTFTEQNQAALEGLPVELLGLGVTLHVVQDISQVVHTRQRVRMKISERLAASLQNLSTQTCCCV